MKLPRHVATTAQLAAAHPFWGEPGYGRTGSYMGQDLFGAPFWFDPFQLYAAGVVTSPNMAVVGQIGRGKSAMVKSLLWRQAVLGRQGWVLDPKGEYGALAAAWGVRPIRIAPGGQVRLNPLDAAGGSGAGPGGGADLLCSLAEVTMRRSVTPRERAAVVAAVTMAAREQPPTTVPAVVDQLMRPTQFSASALSTDVRALAEDGRDVALELRRLVNGDLAGLFDGPTTPGLDLDAPLVVLDLSPLYGSKGLGVLMTCALAWMGARLMTGDGVKRYVVVDEAWALLSELTTARWLQASWKLSRAWGVSNVVVVHRATDLAAVGPRGSQVAGLAEGLLLDSETKVIFAQPASEARRAASLLDLGSSEESLLPRLGRGLALWKVGGRSFLVRHRLGGEERALVDTDAAMGQVPRATETGGVAAHPRGTGFWPLRPVTAGASSRPEAR
ncbi:MAG: ATP-binding protein [Actinomycetota bacterium]|nr:ATP-binding protein [Actinomycetota bacterium]